MASQKAIVSAVFLSSKSADIKGNTSLGFDGVKRGGDGWDWLHSQGVNSWCKGSNCGMVPEHEQFFATLDNLERVGLMYVHRSCPICAQRKVSRESQVSFAHELCCCWYLGLERCQPSGTGMTLSSIFAVGQANFSLCSNPVKQLWLACRQRSISSRT